MYPLPSKFIREGGVACVFLSIHLITLGPNHCFSTMRENLQLFLFLRVFFCFFSFFFPFFFSKFASVGTLLRNHLFSFGFNGGGCFALCILHYSFFSKRCAENAKPEVFPPLSGVFGLIAGKYSMPAVFPSSRLALNASSVVGQGDVFFLPKVPRTQQSSTSRVQQLTDQQTAQVV